MGSISIHSSSSVEDAMPMETLHNRTNRQSNLNGLAGRGAELEERRVSAHGGRPNATSNLEKWLFGKNCLDRKLKRHHITSMFSEKE